MGDSGVDKFKQASELQSSIQARMLALSNGSIAGLSNFGSFPNGSTPGTQSSQSSLNANSFSLPESGNDRKNRAATAKVILDSQGRTIDAQTGELLEMPHFKPSLRANIRAQKQEKFRSNLKKGAVTEDLTENKFYDPRLSAKFSLRHRRGFKFYERSKFTQLAHKLRMKSHLEKLQGEISHAARRTGIASATRLAAIQPKKEVQEGDIPAVEWWDMYILEDYSCYPDVCFSGEELLPSLDGIQGLTNLVEHPMKLAKFGGSNPPPEIPVYLTKKEQKKLRRQRRREDQKELQEKIRLGLAPPPEPKVKIGNMMRVLASEAVQDPSKVEARVRAQMAARQKKHEAANQARKLSATERRDKKARKLQEDTSDGLLVSVYRLRDFSNPARKFKVEANIGQLFLTGFCVLHRDCNVVVVEGGPKQQKKFKTLMLHRIKWSEDLIGDRKKDECSESSSNRYNSCDLVWEGSTKVRAFTGMTFKLCPTESFAREQLRRYGVEHYWNLAYGGSVLQTAINEDELGI